MDNIVPDEWDAHIAACYDPDALRTALCAWCRQQVELCERAVAALPSLRPRRTR